MVALPVAVYVGGRTASRGLVTDGRRALAFIADGHPALLTFVFAVALALSATRASILGRALVGSMSPHLAASATVLIALGAVGSTCALALIVSTLAAPHALARLPGAARSMVAESPPYGSLVLAAARKLVDRDGDGYSPILGGGDCDDHDARVHPGAVDVPGDGIDQNCSGADAEPQVDLPLIGAEDAVAAPATRAKAAARPNIAILLIDALRPDHLHFAGYSRATSPSLDRFRESATYFRHAYAPAPSTRYALTSLFTGLEVSRAPHAPHAGGPRAEDLTLAPEAVTLAERLDEAGYDRVGLPIGYVVEHMPGMGQGFRLWAPPWAGQKDIDIAAGPPNVGSASTRDRPIFLFADDQRAGVHFAARGVVRANYKYVRDLTSGAEDLFDRDPTESLGLSNDMSRDPRARAALRELAAMVDAHDALP